MLFQSSSLGLLRRRPRVIGIRVLRKPGLRPVDASERKGRLLLRRLSSLPLCCKHHMAAQPPSMRTLRRDARSKTVLSQPFLFSSFSLLFSQGHRGGRLGKRPLRPATCHSAGLLPQPSAVAAASPPDYTNTHHSLDQHSATGRVKSSSSFSESIRVYAYVAAALVRHVADVAYRRRPRMAVNMAHSMLVYIHMAAVATRFAGQLRHTHIAVRIVDRVLDIAVAPDNPSSLSPP